MLRAGGIYTIHVQSSGLRFATGGADSLVKIWSMAPVVDVQKEPAGPLVLATLTDHSSSVNTVRFSKNGKLLASGVQSLRGPAGRGFTLPPLLAARNATCCWAFRRPPPGRWPSSLAHYCPCLLATPTRSPFMPPAGSDDHMACIFEHRPGPGATALGGGTNLENWRLKLVLRGHSNNVVDLGWSPDDSRLATASIDNAASGQRLKTLDYHTSFVKGLAWDPVGTYLATQVRGAPGMCGGGAAVVCRHGLLDPVRLPCMPLSPECKLCSRLAGQRRPTASLIRGMQMGARPRCTATHSPARSHLSAQPPTHPPTMHHVPCRSLRTRVW